ncbi:unnamed protein product, partial [Iphiclides podalirius]
MRLRRRKTFLPASVCYRNLWKKKVQTVMRLHTYDGAKHARNETRDDETVAIPLTHNTREMRSLLLPVRPATIIHQSAAIFCSPESKRQCVLSSQSQGDDISPREVVVSAQDAPY